MTTKLGDRDYSVPLNTHSRQGKGERNSNWKGDAVSPDAARSRAQRQYALIGKVCADCGRPAQDRHHQDDNPYNNARANIAFLCRRCHMKRDGRLDTFRVNSREGSRRSAETWRGRAACVNGHQYTSENSRIYITGPRPDRGGRTATVRVCRICETAYKKRRKDCQGTGSLT